MSSVTSLTGAEAINVYLQSENDEVRKAMANLTSMVHAAANQSVQNIQKSRERISDATDHLDGILSKELGLSQAEEIKEIALIAHELDRYFDEAICKKALSGLFKEVESRVTRLEEREAHLEQIIRQRVADAERKAKIESTSSKGLFESALSKAEKVVDQNKITRFVCSTVARFQDEFELIQSATDVEHLTRIFQETIEPFQTTKLVAGRDGKLVKVSASSFPEDCYQDLFLFFYKYYNELMDIYDANKSLPSTADEIGRIFKKKKKGVEQIISEMHNWK
ncbi:hypothetical protein [Desulfosediminicola ganghwensis]|uniref:hypothetical protein n=1 Tax=Desulfosediminicola ganghwensis TaxID=2569540 RepID=UPI0010ACCAAA|nr:hypothetical protein [Desulfosediminicola ganghwensis]